MNPVIEDEKRLSGDHYVVDLLGEEQRAFSFNRDDVACSPFLGPVIMEVTWSFIQ